jgi:hypothetical protein
MSKNEVIRPGDTVRILRPYVIDRIGYPKSVMDYFPDEDTDELRAAEMLLSGRSLDAVITRFHPNNEFRDTSTVLYKTKSLAAYLSAHVDGFGGKNRSIHYRLLSWWEGCRYKTDSMELDPESFVPFTSKVVSKRVAKTGTYYPPRTFSSYWDEHGDWDDHYYPGGLDDMQTHVIILTLHGEFHRNDVELIKDNNE